MSSWKGRSSSRMIKIAPETDSAPTNKAVMTVALRDAKRPKLAKMTLSQKTKTTRNAMGIEIPLCSNSSQRVCPKLIAIVSAWA